MRNYIRRTMDVLEGLGFRVDLEDRKVRTDRWIFTHANQPDERLTVNFDSSETRCRVLEQRAKVIAGLATSGATPKQTPRTNQRIKAERAAIRQRQEAARRAAEARDAKERAIRAADQIEGRKRELDRMLRGVPASDGGRVAIAPDAMLTLAQVADLTGLTDKAVRRAIDSEKLEAYMCGGVIKVKGRDVQRWLAA